MVSLRPRATMLQLAAFESIPELHVTTGDTEYLELGGSRRPIVILPRPKSINGLTTDDMRVPAGKTGIVVARALTAAERASIEDAGLSWCDARGAAHLAWPGVYFHVDRPRRSATQPRRDDVAGLGAASLRGVQIMLNEPGGSWSVARLAKAAALSTGQAHNVLNTLDASRLLQTEGRGPKQRRYIRDANETLEWLADIERRRRRPQAAAGYLYARTYEDLIDRFATRAADANLTYALTASAGAVARGYRVVTNPIVLHVRATAIEPVHALDRLGLELLEAEDAGLGMNLEIWTDVGELGTFDAATVHHRKVPVRVASNVRIWLDMVRQGGRNADAAALFKEQALDPRT